MRLIKRAGRVYRLVGYEVSGLYAGALVSGDLAHRKVSRGRKEGVQRSAMAAASFASEKKRAGGDSNP